MAKLLAISHPTPSGHTLPGRAHSSLKLHQCPPTMVAIGLMATTPTIITPLRVPMPAPSILRLAHFAAESFRTFIDSSICPQGGRYF